MIVEIVASKSNSDLFFPWSAKSLTCPLIEVSGVETKESALNELRGIILCTIGNYKIVPNTIEFRVIEHTNK